ncbi:actin nucleation-promoting factor WASL-like [Pelobates fuscus]|uniref:actin nucleation-promoting factor WASL-like n=1 Tax=Pelobates fuscus TaxID=191477 RepID=UPI002FE4E44D
MALFNLIGSMFQVPETPAQNGSIYCSPRQSFKQLTPKNKLRKTDIGSPTNFTHVTHVGWNSVPPMDMGSDYDLKKLFHLAGITNDHLRDRQMSRKIFEVIEKKGGMEAVRKETLRLTTVERPRHFSRLRSLSSSSLTPSKRAGSTIVHSPQAVKIQATTPPSAFNYLPSLSRVPPPIPTPPSLKDFQATRPLFSQSQSSKDLSLASELVPACKSTTRNPPLPPKPKIGQCFSNIKAPPPYLPFTLGKNSKTDAPLPSPLNEESSLEKPKPENQGTTTDDVLAPPPPPPLPQFMKSTSENKPTAKSVDPSTINSFTALSQKACIQRGGVPLPDKTTFSENCPNVFLDQIKQGVQLKTVVQASKTDSVHSSNIVNALMDVIQKRHKAIQSSDEDGEVDDEWED